MVYNLLKKIEEEIDTRCREALQIYRTRYENLEGITSKKQIRKEVSDVKKQISTERRMRLKGFSCLSRHAKKEEISSLVNKAIIQYLERDTINDFSLNIYLQIRPGNSSVGGGNYYIYTREGKIK